METRCQFSKLTIPAEGDYASVAGKYTGEVAKLIGFDDTDCRKIELGVSQAVSQVVRYSFNPGEMATLDVSCERVPTGLKVAIADKGLPLDPRKTQEGECPVDIEGHSSQLICIEDYMDEVRFNNLGREGKETVLIKHLPSKSIADYNLECELEPYTNPSAHERPASSPLDCSVRTMKPSDAVEVSKCIYQAYGYSYGYELLYYPEKLAALNESGQVHSAVAVINGEEIVGHCALISWDMNSAIAEMGQGVVKPEYRSQGCFVKLTEYLLERAKSLGLTGVFGQAVTNHTYSQQVGHRFGLRDCALILGYIPMTVKFRELTEDLTQRGSLIVHFRYLGRPAQLPLYAPENHAEMIRKLYSNVGYVPEFGNAGDKGFQIEDSHSIIRTTTIGALNFARIEINSYGTRVVEELRSTTKELCLKGTSVINLYLDLSDPGTFHLTAEFERLGFFFAGILPAAARRGDALILQYLNNLSIDYDQIHVASDVAKELISYIRLRDPAR